MKHKAMAITVASVLAAALVYFSARGQENAPAAANDKSSTPPAIVKNIKIERGLTPLEKECIECHAKEMPGRVHDWSQSVMARANVTCLDCHRALLTDKDARDCPGTAKYPDVKISPVVSSAKCGRCHPREFEENSRSKHARTYQIQTEQLKDPWLQGMTNETERAAGCWNCHGSDLSSGVLTRDNWPNEGCGRINPDGSLGSCVICHTSHTFSLAQARRPETCGQCHLGPDHPQDEIYFESKHGKIYLAQHDKWDFEAAPDIWSAGSHYTAPTCAVCHMSGAGVLATSHDVGERLKWETKRPLAIMNEDHDGMEARKKMLAVCNHCHSPTWSTNYLDRFDDVIANYNENYYKPVKAMMDDLYARGLLTKFPVFDEEIEWKFYEYWHHEGRRARMGAMMMGPDYSWWHGFYELKRDYQELMAMGEEIEKTGHGSPRYFPGTGGKDLTPLDLPAMPGGWKDVKNVQGVPENK